MHITLEADYAVRIVIFLAQRQSSGQMRVDANTISENTGVTLRFALKILRNLVGCGLAKSFKGTQGGYELNKAPDQITLRELLAAVEGEYAFSRCVHGGDCSKPNNTSCKVQHVFCEVSELVKNKLDSVTVAELM